MNGKSTTLFQPSNKMHPVNNIIQMGNDFGFLISFNTWALAFPCFAIVTTDKQICHMQFLDTTCIHQWCNIFTNAF